MSTLRRILAYAWPHRLLLFRTWLAQIGQVAIALATPFVIREAIDRGIGASDYPYLLTLGGALVAISLVRGLLWFTAIFGYHRIAHTVAWTIRDRLYEKVQRSTMAFHTGAKSGDLFSHATIDLSAIEEFLIAGIRDTITLVVMSSLVLVMLLSTEPALTLTALPVYPLVAILAIAYARPARERYRRIQMEYGRTTSMLQENLNGVRVVRAFAREDHEQGRFLRQVSELFVSQVRVAKLNASTFPTMTLLTNLGVATVLWFGGQRVMAGEMSLGSLVAFISYLTMLVAPVRSLGMTINLITGAIAGAERIHRLLDGHHVIQEVDDAARKPDIGRVSGHIAFEHVSFGYKPAERVLDDVSFEVKPGQTIGLVGLTGAGKTTIAMLLGRFYDPRSGAVRIDGHDLRDVNVYGLRRQIGFVFQEAILFSATIGQNIAFGRPGASQAEIEAAARAACLHDFIVGLPDGYATMVGERGITLSGGQRQRLSLARALLIQPRILVLDDTTSAVDPVTERQIWSRVRASRSDLTTLIIAQRLASVRDADQILVLAGARIAERGSHAELIASNGLYAQLYRQQESQVVNVIDDEAMSMDAGPAAGAPTPAGGDQPLVSEDASAVRAVLAARAAVRPDGRKDVLALNPEDDTLTGKAYDHGMMQRLLEFLGPFKLLLAGTIGAMAVASAAGLLNPYLQKTAIDGPITQADVPGMGTVALAFVGVSLVQWLASVGYNYLLGLGGQELLRSIRLRIFGHLQSLSLGFYDRYKVGRLMSIMTGDVQAISNLLGNGVVVAIADFFILIGVFIALLSMDPRLSLYTFSVLPAVVIAVSVLRHYAREAWRSVRRSSSILNGAFAENIQAVRVTQAFVREEVNRSAFGVLNDTLLANVLKAARLMAIFGPTMDLISSLGTAMILGFGGYLVLSHQLSIGVLVAFLAYVTRFFEPIRDLAMRYQALQAAMAASERIFALLDTQPIVVDKPDAARLPAISGELEIDHVTFGYLPGRTVLHDIDLRIRPGEQVAIVGPTGAGKTSIISLACRFYDVNEGAIRVDGIDLRDVTQESLRRQVSVVLQEPFLFAGTVAENLRFARLDATQEELEAACRAVGVHPFIVSLPMGYQTDVSERGANLSAGQRQLISFARALLADPRILILDEATSSVDTMTESQVQAALRVLLKGRTAIVIAHRLSTIRSADRIVVLEAGRIAEIGPHAELIRAGGHYARLNLALARSPASTR